MAEDSTTSVAVIGGGLAGMTAALRLAERGYEVTLFEKTATLGGCVSSCNTLNKEGTYLDVYPHMFSDWDENFWQVMEDVLDIKPDEREKKFSPRMGIQFIMPDGRRIDLENPTSLPSIVSNLFSKFEPIADMFLYGFSAIDFASREFNADNPLDRHSVNGFLYSQAYATMRVARVYDLVTTDIWSNHSNQTSAIAYQKFTRHNIIFHDAPFAWLLKGSYQEHLMDPFQKKLEAAGCTVNLEAQVNSLHLKTAKGGKETVELAVKSGRKTSKESFDTVVCAVPPDVLGFLAQSPAAKKEERLVEKVPSLSEVRRLRNLPLPVAYIFFNTKLDKIPDEHVGLGFSRLDLTFFDLSQLWVDDPVMKDRTVLALACSNYYSMPDSTYNRNPDQDGYEMLVELKKYLPQINIGTEWGDKNADIDWELSCYTDNLTHKLYLNDVNSGMYAPEVNYPEVPNVFFAGDFCPNEVGMATVESAVETGLLAAKALRERYGQKGDAILIHELPKLDEELLLATKLLLTPVAYLAKAYSLATDTAEFVQDKELLKASAKAASMIRLPFAYTADVAETTYSLARTLISSTADRIREQQADNKPKPESVRKKVKRYNRNRAARKITRS